MLSRPRQHMPKRANHAGAANACHPCNQLLSSHADLAKKLEALEKKYDVQFKVVFDAIRQLMKPSEKPKGRIGFRTGGERGDA